MENLEKFGNFVKDPLNTKALRDVKAEKKLIEQSLLLSIQQNLKNPPKDEKSLAEIFANKDAQVLFLKNFTADVNEANDEKRKLLLNLACKMFTQETLKAIDRELAVQWITFFENYHQQLDHKKREAFSNFHIMFKFRPGENRKQIKVICLDNQIVQIPLVLLLTYKIFQRKFYLDSDVLQLNETANTVVEAFKKYLFDATSLPKSMSSYSLIDFLEIARFVNDPNLKKFCYTQLEAESSEEYLKLISNAIFKGEKALHDKKITVAKKKFEKAIKDRPDIFSEAALGKIARFQKEYPRICFKNIYEQPPFSEKFYFCQAQANLEYINFFENSINKFMQQLSIFGRAVVNFDEDLSKEKFSKWFTDHLQEHFTDHRELIKNFNSLQGIIDILKNIEGWENRIIAIENHLQLLILHVKEKLLSQTETLLKKLPPNEFKTYLLRIKMLHIEKKYEEEKEAFDEIKNQFSLSSKEIVKLNQHLAKYYKAINDIEQEKNVLLEAFELDKTNDEINRQLFILGLLKNEDGINLEDLAKKYDNDFEVQYKYAILLFSNQEYEKSKTYFLKSDFSLDNTYYNSNLNCFLGKIEGKAAKNDSKTKYFRDAITTAMLDKLSFDQCCEISKHFTEGKKGKNQDRHNLLNIFLYLTNLWIVEQSDFERELINLLTKINDLETCNQTIPRLKLEDGDAFLERLTQLRDQIEENPQNQESSGSNNEKDPVLEEDFESETFVSHISLGNDTQENSKIPDILSEPEKYLRKGKTQRAIGSLMTLMKGEHKNNPQVLTMLATAYQTDKDTKDDKKLKKLIEIGNTLKSNQYYVQASNVFRFAIQIDPENQEAGAGYREAMTHYPEISFDAISQDHQFDSDEG